MDFKISEIPAYVKALFFVGWLLPSIVTYTTVHANMQSKIEVLEKDVEEAKADHTILLLLANNFANFVENTEDKNDERDEKFKKLEEKIEDLWFANAEEIKKYKKSNNE